MENQHQQQQQVVVEGLRIWAGDDKFINVDGKTPKEIIKLARKFHPSLGKDAELMINGASLYPKDWISFTKGLGGLVTFWDSGVVYGELPKKEALAPNSRGSNGARSSFASGKDQSTRRGRKDLIGASREIHKRNGNVGMEGTGGKKRKRSQAESEVDEKGEVGFELNPSSRLPKPSGSGGKVGETAPIQKQRKDWGMLYQIYLQDMTVEDALSLLKILGLVKCKSELELKKLVPKLVSTGQVVAVHSDCYFRVEKVDIHLADIATSYPLLYFMNILQSFKLSGKLHTPHQIFGSQRSLHYQHKDQH